VTGREGLEAYAGNTPAVTDDYPLIEYATWLAPKEIARSLPNLLAQQTEPPLENATDELRSQIREEHTTLNEFYDAGIAAYNGDKDAWADAMKKVISADANNPYFNWISGKQ
jgi:hypothetical protein